MTMTLSGQEKASKTTWKQPYARILGDDFIYLMFTNNVTIGRKSPLQIDVKLGDSPCVSRKHIELIYNNDKLYLKCFGKNGVFIDGEFQTYTLDPVPLPQCFKLRFPSTTLIISVEVLHSANLEKLYYNPKKRALYSVSQSDPQHKKDKQCIRSQSPDGSSSSGGSAILDEVCTKRNCSPIPNPTGDRVIRRQEQQLGPGKSEREEEQKTGAPSRHGTDGTIVVQSEKLAMPTCCPTDSEQQQTPSCSNQSQVDVSTSTPTSRPITLAHGTQHRKPPYSYAQMIIQAIISAPNHKLTLSGIYGYISTQFPYYRPNEKGWQNSIRHNLSLNRYFIRVPRSQEEPGKGAFWCLDPSCEARLTAQAFRKRRQRTSTSGTTGAPQANTNTGGSQEPLLAGQWEESIGDERAGTIGVGRLTSASPSPAVQQQQPEYVRSDSAETKSTGDFPPHPATSYVPPQATPPYTSSSTLLFKPHPVYTSTTSSAGDSDVNKFQYQLLKQFSNTGYQAAGLHFPNYPSNNSNYSIETNNWSNPVVGNYPIDVGHLVAKRPRYQAPTTGFPHHYQHQQHHPSPTLPSIAGPTGGVSAGCYTNHHTIPEQYQHAVGYQGAGRPSVNHLHLATFGDF